MWFDSIRLLSLQYRMDGLKIDGIPNYKLHNDEGCRYFVEWYNSLTTPARRLTRRIWCTVLSLLENSTNKILLPSYYYTSIFLLAICQHLEQLINEQKVFDGAKCLPFLGKNLIVPLNAIIPYTNPIYSAVQDLGRGDLVLPPFLLRAPMR
jgi:hypothetical protein